MSIAIITGASSGMGAEFANQIPYYYQSIDEVWLVARNIDKLNNVAEEISSNGFCHKVKCFSVDLCNDESVNSFEEVLIQNKPKVKILVNCAGCGRVGDFADIDYSVTQNIINLNCLALTKITKIVLPFMIKNSHIINLASAAAFLPQPGFNVYAASKAFVHRFSKALGVELRDKKISVTSVCPGPVDTEFFEYADPNGNIKPIKRLFMANPSKVVSKAIKDAALNKNTSIYGLSMNLLYFASKIVPECIFMKFIY